MANTSGVWSVLGALFSLGALAGCGPGDFTSPTYDFESDPPPLSGTSTFNTLFEGKTVRATGKVAPIAGGTLLIARDGGAIAADPDRDQVHLVDLKTKVVRSVQLREGDEPGRVVDGPVGVAYVAARRGGVVLAVDTAAATARRISVCAAPRGLAYDDAHHQLFVACRSGVLAVVDTTTEEVVQRFRLDPDLRDVLLSGDDLVVSRFKSAEVLVVNRSGDVLRRATPGANPANASSVSVTPSVAYRTLQAPGGGVLVGHVAASDVTLPSGAGAYYGAPCGGSVADPTLSVVDTEPAAAPPSTSTPGVTPAPTVALSTRLSLSLGGMAGPLDMAFAPGSSKLAVLAIGNSWALTPGNKPASLAVTQLDQLGSGPLSVSQFCGVAAPSSFELEGEPVAVAFESSGGWVVQSREPAQLQLESGEAIALASDARFDTGLAMFHMNTGGGIACTSCHPEAGEDGHTWNFTVGPRRSQSLEGQASARAPFHWSGDLLTFDDLFQEVMVKRMSLTQTVDAAQRGALRDWLDSVPRQDTADDLDAESVARGAVLFNNKRVGCATCHSGSDYTDNLAHDVGTSGIFVTPSLVGVNLRAPLFHDGCAASLVGRFGLCGGGDRHGITSDLTVAQRSDLVAFMQSL